MLFINKSLIIAVLSVGAAAVGAPTAMAGPLLKDGQTVVASFDSGKLKGKTFRLRFKEKKNLLKDRPVTEHTKDVLAIKTPGGWCRFEATGRAECHNGKGKWRAK